MARFMIIINGKNTNSYKSKSVAISTFWRKAQQLLEGSEILLYDIDNCNTLYELYINSTL